MIKSLIEEYTANYYSYRDSLKEAEDAQSRADAERLELDQSFQKLLEAASKNSRPFPENGFVEDHIWLILYCPSNKKWYFPKCERIEKNPEPLKDHGLLYRAIDQDCYIDAQGKGYYVGLTKFSESRHEIYRPSAEVLQIPLRRTTGPSHSSYL
jgi:hypothetical protein